MSDFKKTPAGSNVAGFSTLLDRRQLLMGAASAAVGAATLGVASGLGARAARAADRTEISFASASFFGKEGLGELVKAYNESQDRITVKFIELPPPSSSTEVYQGLVQQLARRNGTPDVFTQDVVWIAGFAAAGWALPLDEYFPKEKRADYFPGTVAACTYNEKLTALPWFVDSGMFYYRKDLVEKHGGKVPETWDDMAAKLAGFLDEMG